VLVAVAIVVWPEGSRLTWPPALAGRHSPILLLSVQITIGVDVDPGTQGFGEMCPGGPGAVRPIRERTSAETDL